MAATFALSGLVRLHDDCDDDNDDSDNHNDDDDDDDASTYMDPICAICMEG